LSRTKKFSQPVNKPHKKPKQLSSSAKDPPPKPKTNVLVDDAETSNASSTTGAVVVDDPEPFNALHFPPYTFDATITCHPGLEELLSFELRALGLPHHILRKGGGVQLGSGRRDSSSSSSAITLDDLVQCHLHLGTASQILLQCGPVFSARTWGELQRKMKQLPWQDLLLLNKTSATAGGTNQVELRVKSVSEKSRLFHSNAISQRVMEAIQECMTRESKLQTTPINDASVGDDNAEVVQMQVNIVRDRVKVSLDTSSLPLHRRNYRLETAKAPLREDLAYALVYHAFREAGLIGSKVVRDNKQPTVFIDPFCGSGTIAIEAASMARRLPPGRLREAPFAGTTLYDSHRWNNLVQQSMNEKRSKVLDCRILASDRDAGAIEMARSNARRAGLDESAIAFSTQTISDLPKLWKQKDKAHDEDETDSAFSSRLIIATNPPFGRRIASSKAKKAATTRHHQLLPLYQTFAGRVKELEHRSDKNTIMILADDTNLVRRTFFGYNFVEKLKIKHGGIPVTAMVASSSKKAQ